MHGGCWGCPGGGSVGSLPCWVWCRRLGGVEGPRRLLGVLAQGTPVVPVPCSHGLRPPPPASPCGHGSEPLFLPFPSTQALSPWTKSTRR